MPSLSERREDILLLLQHGFGGALPPLLPELVEALLGYAWPFYGARMSDLDLPRRAEVIAAHKRAGGRVVAALPVHYPRALLRAFDLLPVEVWGPPGVDTAAGDEQLQAYTCSVVRSALAFLRSGGLEPADFILVPHACDSLQGLGSLLLDFVRPRQPVLPLYLPRATGQAAVTFLTEELGALYERLAQLTGLRPGEEALAAAVQREERADGLLARLSRERGALGLADRPLYTIMRTREYLPAERFAALGERVLATRGEGSPSGVPVIVSGMLPEPMAILDAISAAGGRVAADDWSCCGRRLYPAGSSLEPLRRMAESLLGAGPDATRGSSIAARADHLLRLVERTGAVAVIFHLVKFCEPELFYVPELGRALAEKGVRTVSLEVDVSEPWSHQLSTRIEALLETIR